MKKPVNLESYKLASADIEVQGLASVSKAVKESMVNISRNDVRYLVDTYYQMQDFRKSLDNQVRSIEQGYDKVDENNESQQPEALKWIAASFKNDEKQILKMLDAYTDSVGIGRWLKDIIGIGPVISAGLLAYFDINKANHANQFHSYAGLNDNNNPWLGTKGASALVKELKELFPDEDPKNISDNVLQEIYNRYRRDIVTVRRLSQAKDKKNQPLGYVTWDSLQKYLAMPPYNIALKTLCWKIGESFTKVSGKEESLYGRLYRQRKAYETAKNEAGDYAEYAAKCLAQKNYGKGTDAYKAYSEGKLPKAHIQQRAQRATVKIFIAHLFDAMYYEKYRKTPPTPYVLQYMGHQDEILPEIDYKDYII